MLRSVFNKFISNAPLLLTLCAVFWAGNFVIGRGMHATIPPLTMAALRWCLAAGLFLPFALGHLKKDRETIRNNLPVLFVLGATGVGCFNTFAYIGLGYTTALNGLIIQSAGPVIIIVMAFFLFGDRFAPDRLAGVLISLAGVLIIISRASLANLATLSLNSGDLWILAAMAIWALYTVLLRKRPDIHPVSFIAITFAIGAIVNIPGFIWEFVNLQRMEIAPASLAAIAYIAIFPGILSYLFWNRGVALAGSSRAGVFLHLIPLFGTLFAILFLGEQIRLYHGLGFALILSGVSLAGRS